MSLVLHPARYFFFQKATLPVRHQLHLSDIWYVYKPQMLCQGVSGLAVLSKGPPLFSSFFFTTSKVYCENSPNMMIKWVMNMHLKGSKYTYLNSSYEEKIFAKIVYETKILLKIINLHVLIHIFILYINITNLLHKVEFPTTR